ncbi:hypothetical protein HFP89_12210 [Wenzhouxiangella sp. XN79A]|uniref:hypothetical protein n=1 Tax=Wenzhouxiangella sp. XN79A TaxID=2724193 RepID=UPI00144AA137|nr:hypothetical protein [Wenzhouxiangella sp. XN79A]NKI35926.1 hypothetical protein [Wenzhouxiangella sp. XN79A]
MKTLVVSLIFLPFAAVVLAVPLHRLVLPLWPEPVVERLDADNRPVLEPASRVDAPATVRSRPHSAAVIDRVDGAPILGYVVGLRDADGVTRPPPADGFWWPAVVLPECTLGVSRQRVVDWLPCAGIERVHHPNRLSSVARFRVALDRLLGAPPVIPVDALRHETETNAG